MVTKNLQRLNNRANNLVAVFSMAVGRSQLPSVIWLRRTYSEARDQQSTCVSEHTWMSNIYHRNTDHSDGSDAANMHQPVIYSMAYYPHWSLTQYPRTSDAWFTDLSYFASRICICQETSDATKAPARKAKAKAKASNALNMEQVQISTLQTYSSNFVKTIKKKYE